MESTEVLRYVLRRLGFLAATMMVSSFVVFVGLDVAPGDPVAALAGGRSLPPESLQLLREEHRLDDPLLVRYTTWLGNAVQGDLGVSIAQRQSVSDLIAARAPTTASLVLYASLLMVVFGVGLGLLAGLRPGRTDSAVVMLTSALIAVPPFIAAIALAFVFAVLLGWFPAFGTGAGPLDRIYHLTLPAIALAIAPAAALARITRTAIHEQLSREHVQTAVSRGLARRHIVWRHVLRNAAIPIITLGGVSVAAMIALSAVVERAFSVNGLGAYLVKATLTKDIALVQGICLILVLAFVVVNTMVDLLAAALDPRIAH